MNQDILPVNARQTAFPLPLISSNRGPEVNTDQVDSSTTVSEIVYSQVLEVKNHPVTIPEQEISS